MRALAFALAITLTGCASSGAYRVSQIALVSSAVADIHSTRLALATGKAREVNPLMPESLWGSIAVKAGWTVPTLWLTSHVGKSNRIAATLMQTAMASVWGVVALRNYRLGAR